MDRNSSNQTEWELDSQTKAPFDPLLNCLIVLTKHYHKSFSPQTLIAGLPLVNNKLTPELFARAANRAGLSANAIKQPLNKCKNHLLPAVALLKHQQACIVTKISGDTVYTMQPETGVGEVEMSLKEFNKLYADHMIFIKPAHNFDSRTKNEAKSKNKHWFWGFIRRAWPVYSEVLVASFLINLFVLAGPLFIMNVYDRVVPNNATETLWVLAIGVLVVYLFDFLLRTLRSYFIDTVGKRIDAQLSSNIFEKILDIRMDVRPGSVGVLSNTVQSFETFREFITSATISTLVDLPFVILFLSVIAMIGGIVAWVPVVIIPLMVLISLLIQVPMSNLIKDAYRHSGERQAVLFESLAGMETIKGMGAESPVQRRWEAISNESTSVSMKLRALINFGSNSATFLQHIATILVIIVGVYSIAAGNMTIGALIACTILTGRAMGPMVQVVNLINRYQQSSAALKSIDKVMNLPVERPNDKTFLHRDRLKGDIKFKNVNFTYPDQSIAALHNVTCTIKAGERVAILGRMGSGKSTFAKLIMNFYQPSEGNVLIDNTDIRQIDPAQLRHDIGYIPQDVVLFHGSIRDNIVYGAPYVDNDRIIYSAKVGAVDDFIQSHPDGFDCQTGERGQYLSGGQQQSIAIARSVVLNPSIFLYDEPCNSMDDATTAKFIQRFAPELEKGKTLIMVTHKSALLRLVDRLIVFDNGRIVLDGARQDVLHALATKRGSIPSNKPQQTHLSNG